MLDNLLCLSRELLWCHGSFFVLFLQGRFHGVRQYVRSITYYALLYSVLITLRGDVNKDSKRNLTDIIFLVNYIFKGGAAPNPAEIGNVNCSAGLPNLTDIIYMVNYVFKGGQAPCS